MTFCVLILSVSSIHAQRVTVSLNGTWQIEESVGGEEMPRSYSRTVTVPGLANLATPAFEDVDRFESRELIANLIRRGERPAAAAMDGVGVSLQKRNFFWYARTFRVPRAKQTALLKINKAQFGTVVWLNGKKIGEHMGCFTAGYFDLTNIINRDGENRLVVRVGAHPAAIPARFPAGTDQEKIKWTPGIYDDVSLLLSDNPVIENVQVAPRIRSPEIVVQTVVKNYGKEPVAFRITNLVKTWKTKENVEQKTSDVIRLTAGERLTVTETIKIPNARLWSPDDPFLYAVETMTSGDTTLTRFGMREFRFDTATRRAYLNDKIYYLRGSNIGLHRFFEDPLCKGLPWDERWVRKLLIDIPKRLNWNSFRFTIGPVPDKWLEIADEAGLLIQHEFPIWRYHDEWDTGEMIKQFGDFMRDSWNHPSVVTWDACNETRSDVIGDEIIPAVRGLDLQNRAWDNGYNPPVGADDPVENHPYFFIRFFAGRARGEKFEMTELETMSGEKKAQQQPHPTAHAMINNEYGWLWLTRDGQPTRLTQQVYTHLTGENATPAERFAMNGYLLGGLTEYWRAYRNFAGVQHFVYLTASYPGVFTADHFRDIEKLELEPNFADYMTEASRPLGVYVNFWQPTLPTNTERDFMISLVNDEYDAVRGKLILTLETSDGAALTRAEKRFDVSALGQQTLALKLKTPVAVARGCTLKAVAYPENRSNARPTVSRRRVSVSASGDTRGRR